MAGIVGSNPIGGCLSIVSVVLCQVEDSTTVRSLVQRSLADCGVSERSWGLNIEEPRAHEKCRAIKERIYLYTAKYTSAGPNTNVNCKSLKVYKLLMLRC